MSAVVDYLDALGAQVDPQAAPGRPRVLSAMLAIEAYEQELSLRMLKALHQPLTPSSTAWAIQPWRSQAGSNLLFQSAGNRSG